MLLDLSGVLVLLAVVAVVIGIVLCTCIINGIMILKVEKGYVFAKSTSEKGKKYNDRINAIEEDVERIKDDVADMKIDRELEDKE